MHEQESPNNTGSIEICGCAPDSVDANGSLLNCEGELLRIEYGLLGHVSDLVRT